MKSTKQKTQKEGLMITDFFRSCTTSQKLAGLIMYHLLMLGFATETIKEIEDGLDRFDMGDEPDGEYLMGVLEGIRLQRAAG
jgi:hypothetical protein